MASHKKRSKAPRKEKAAPDKESKDLKKPEKAAERISENVPEKSEDKAAEKVSDKADTKAEVKATEKVSEKASEKKEAKAPEKKSESADAKPSEKSSVKHSEKPAKKAEEKVSDRAEVKVEEKTDDTEKKSNGKNCDRNMTVILSLVLFVLTIIGIVILFLMPDTPRQPKPGSGESSLEPEGDKPPEIIYKAPAYKFNEEKIYITAPQIEHEYTIAWVSDVHMITDFTAGDVSAENLETVKNRYETLSVTPEGIHGKDLWPEIINYLNYNDFDAVIFGGDILDYCSTSNMEALQKEFDRLKYSPDRILYLRADHDVGTWYSNGSTGFNDSKAYELHAELDGNDESHKYIDFGDLVIAGVNMSVRNPGETQMEVLNDLYSRGVPVITATHVPYYSQTDSTLEELSMRVRNKIYYWSPDGELYNPDQEMQEYLDLIYDEDSPCVIVLAGHMHAMWDGEIRDGLREHIFSPAFSGTIGVIHVLPEISKDDD